MKSRYAVYGGFCIYFWRGVGSTRKFQELLRGPRPLASFKDNKGVEYKIFGEGGVEKTAKEFKKKFLGHIPLDQDLRVSADKGEPLTYSQPEHEISKKIKKIAEEIKQSFQ